MHKIKLALCCSVGLLAAATAVMGCGHEKTVVRRETVQTVPAPVVRKQTTTVETEHGVPIREERTVVSPGQVVEHRTTTVEEED